MSGYQVSESELIYKEFENSVDFNEVVLPKPASHSARPPVIAAKPGHSGEKQGQGRDRGKNMNIRDQEKGHYWRKKSEVMVSAAILCGAGKAKSLHRPKRRELLWPLTSLSS